MNCQTSFCITALVLASSALAAQPLTPAFDLRPVLVPGTIIGGHTFDRDTIIEGAAINDKDDVAFVAHWPVDGSTHASVFTLHRVVSDGKGVIDGKVLTSILYDARVAISASGVVAYEASYDLGDAPGVFVEQRRYAITPAEHLDLESYDFKVEDDGKVVMGVQSRPCAGKPDDHRKSGIPLRIIPPKLPRQIPVAIGSPQQSAPRAKAASACNPLPMFSSNGIGQIVIPVSTPEGPYLFIATSVKH
jgi:hypothetical protein